MNILKCVCIIYIMYYMYYEMCIYKARTPRTASRKRWEEIILQGNLMEQSPLCFAEYKPMYLYSCTPGRKTAVCFVDEDPLLNYWPAGEKVNSFQSWIWVGFALSQLQPWCLSTARFFGQKFLQEEFQHDWVLIRNPCTCCAFQQIDRMDCLKNGELF